MSVPPFNTLEVYKTLREHGFNDEQASGAVEALRQVFAPPPALVGGHADNDMIDTKIRTATTRLKADFFMWLYAAVLFILTVLVIVAGR